MPTRQEWEDFWRLPGGQGGMEARTTTREELREESRHRARPPDLATLNDAIDLAQQDMKELARRLYRTGLRRAHT
eukprot:2435175-Pyramimonas_sp.AAC.1